MGHNIWINKAFLNGLKRLGSHNQGVMEVGEGGWRWGSVIPGVQRRIRAEEKELNEKSACGLK